MIRQCSCRYIRKKPILIAVFRLISVESLIFSKYSESTQALGTIQDWQ
jgi:hypothetical protein